jgi:glucosamine-6-phosphate deaminase
MRIEVFPAAEWAGAVANEWIERVGENPSLRLCLPTGATPRPLYHELAALRPELGETEIFLLDEFLGLPPGNPGRCDEMLRADFTDLIDGLPSITAMDPDGDLDEEVRRYEAAVTAGGLDLTLLGLGRNGHLALNEPGSTPADRTRVVELHPATAAITAEVAGTLPTGGITLGLANILESREIWLLVTGSAKADILAAAVEGPIGPEVPASYLRIHDDVTVFADEAAAGSLRSVR